MTVLFPSAPVQKKPRGIRAGLSLDGEIGGARVRGAPRLTRLVNANRFPSFLLFLSGKEFGELHRQVP